MGSDRMESRGGRMGKSGLDMHIVLGRSLDGHILPISSLRKAVRQR